MDAQTGVGRAAYSEEELDAGAALFRTAPEFMLSVAAVQGLPAGGTDEVAFAGRSNVGKSSLLNALAGRKALARISNTPGRTRMLNFYDLGGRVRLVDMPGYGYASAPKRQVAEWTELVFAYLKGRRDLKRAFLLIDARHGIMAGDLAAMDLLDGAAVSYQVVLTKIDKIAAGALAGRLAEVAGAIARRAAAHPHIVATSARQREGLEELRAAIAAAAR
jgi:GTP-binding protein